MPLYQGEDRAFSHQFQTKITFFQALTSFHIFRGLTTLIFDRTSLATRILWGWSQHR